MRRNIFDQNSPVAVLARRISHPRDPPGQKSIYILPGDHREQVYRLLTFKEFPNNNVDPYTLAKDGFYYTGYKDRAKCHSCGVAVEGWKLGSDSNFSVWHQEDCAYLTNRNESSRYNSNTSLNNHDVGFSSTDYAITSSPTPVTAGEVLMSNASSGQPPFSSTMTSTWTTTQQSNSSRPVSTVNTSILTVGPDPNNASIPQRNSSVFPCSHPINPHMRDSENRIQTFADRATNWPAHRINATPREIVDAGFFYLGERDRVKCWYCNGGLQNWERNDNPWEEHAKWFPLCEYVLQQKGVEFVHRIVSQTPNLRRPSLYNPANIEFPNMLPRRNSLVGLPQATSAPEASEPEIIDPQQRLHEMQRKIEQDMSSSELVQQALLMGFRKEAMKSVLKSQYEMNDVGFSNFESMVDALLRQENDENSQNDTQEANSNPEEEANEEEPTSSGQTELKQLVDARKCKVCHKEDACMVFVPCGHLTCCLECGNKVSRCPACRSFIKERIRSYLS